MKHGINNHCFCKSCKKLYVYNYYKVSSHTGSDSSKDIQKVAAKTEKSSVKKVTYYRL